MKRIIRRGLSIVVVGLFTAQSVLAAVACEIGSHPATSSATKLATAAYSSAGPVEPRPSLDQVTSPSSWEIAQLAEESAFDPQEIKLKTDGLEKELKQREGRFKSESKAAAKRIEAKESELRHLRQGVKDPATVQKRKQIQCEIAGITKDLTDRAFAFLQAQNSTDVQIAKLNLLAKWRPARSEIDRKIVDGSIDRRRFGNVLDIGHRGTQKPFCGQADDVKWGEKEIENARQQDRLPKEIDDPVVTEYVNRMAQNIARNSDPEAHPCLRSAPGMAEGR